MTIIIKLVRIPFHCRYVPKSEDGCGSSWPFLHAMTWSASFVYLVAKIGQSSIWLSTKAFFSFLFFFSPCVVLVLVTRIIIIESAAFSFSFSFFYIIYYYYSFFFLNDYLPKVQYYLHIFPSYTVYTRCRMTLKQFFSNTNAAFYPPCLSSSALHKTL